MKKTTPDAPAPTAKIRSQRARPTTVLGRTWVRKSPLVSGLGSRGWPIGAVYAARWAATLHRGPHGEQRDGLAGERSGRSLPAAGDHPGGAEGVLVALHVPVAVAAQDAPDPPGQVGAHLHKDPAPGPEPARCLVDERPHQTEAVLRLIGERGLRFEPPDLHRQVA